MKIDRYKKHILYNWKLAYPIMLSQLSHVVLGITDSIMVGRVGVSSLAAAALANAMFNIILLFGIGVSLAVTPLVAAAEGDKNPSKTAAILRHGLVINTVNGVFLCVLVFFGAETLYLFDQPEEVLVWAVPYLLILAFSLPPVLIFQSFRQFTEGLSHTKAPMVVILSGVALNIGLNYALIYGHAGLPPMGLAGAGWGSLIVRVGMGLAMGLHVYYAPYFRRYRSGFVLGRYSKNIFRKILRIGIPTGVQFIFEVSAFDFSAVMMGWLGARALAAHQIVISLAALSYTTVLGIALATTIRVSNEWGRRDREALKETFMIMLGIAMLFILAWGALFVVGRNVLPTLYIEDVDVVGIASSLLLIAGLFQLSDGVQVVCVGALRGLQDVKIPSLMIFAAYWLIGLPLGYWLAFEAGYGGKGIWWGLLIGLTVTAVATLIRFWRHMQKQPTAKAPPRGPLSTAAEK